MARKLARIVRIDSITAIRKADSLECAHIGGWPVVVRKDENYVAGDRAIYLELDTFLPEGNPAWQFLVDKLPAEFNGRVGHVLRTMTLRGQVSQGMLVKLPADLKDAPLGQEVTDYLGVCKFEEPLPPDLLGKARGYRSSLVPSTDEERVQNLDEELKEWTQAPAGELVWEMTEKVEGNACSFALLDSEFHVLSSQVDYLESDDIPHWIVARRYKVEEILRAHFGDRQVVLQGELVGPGIEGNIYRLTEYDFYLFRVYDVATGSWMSPAQRHAFAREVGIPHAPVIDEAFEFKPGMGPAELLAMADGPSAINPTRRREGVVYKGVNHKLRFKVVSNKYLLNEKL